MERSVKIPWIACWAHFNLLMRSWRAHHRVVLWPGLHLMDYCCRCTWESEVLGWTIEWCEVTFAWEWGHRWKSIDHFGRHHLLISQNRFNRQFLMFLKQFTKLIVFSLMGINLPSGKGWSLVKQTFHDLFILSVDPRCLFFLVHKVKRAPHRLWALPFLWIRCWAHSGGRTLICKVIL